MKSLARKFNIEHWQVISLLLIIYDAVTVVSAYFLALLLRFDFRYSKIPEEFLNSFIKFIPFIIFITITSYAAARMYRSLWRFASFTELIRTFIGVFISAAVHNLTIDIFVQRMPLSYTVFGVVLQFCFAIAVRFAYRFILLLRHQVSQSSNVDIRRAMLIGAGSAGSMIINDSSTGKESGLKIVCVIDDNPNKQGRSIRSVPIVGDRNDILTNVEKYDIDVILIAVPSADEKDKRDIIQICSETKCDLKILPGVDQIVTGEVSFKDFEEVDIADLLGRDVIKVNNSEIFEQIANKVILVTGGGGSIGSELCRQIAAHEPKQLIIFDIYENNAYDIQLELKEKYKNLDLKVFIGSVRDKRKVLHLVHTFKPDIIYHAAAHKHVPLMEDSPCEAIKNNVQGTYNVAYAAAKEKVKKFVLISTDKAVNPTNVMGASKRMCEMIIQTLNEKYKNTDFVAVRFGNVLGSNGSVIPLFKKQIEHGGPVTVTHPDIIRYFMTIPEAVSLVLQAGYYAKGGEIFILDMGEPVKIVDLAKNLIKLSGFEPDVDIPIVYSGLRPGEKLFEEKLMDTEGLEKSPNELIHIAHPLDFSYDTLIKQYEEILSICEFNNEEDLRPKLQQIVPTYHPVGE